MNWSLFKIKSFKTDYPSMTTILEKILKFEPNQEGFLVQSFNSRDSELLSFSEQLATRISTLLNGDVDLACKNYAWMCQEILKEEIYFRRNGEYQVKTIIEAIDKVYGNEDYMAQYLNGILISQLVWLNHVSAMQFYKNNYLPLLSKGSKHLEVGPGHGLLLYLANEINQQLDLTALDISDTSLDRTKLSLSKITSVNSLSSMKANITEVDLLEDKFDSIVMSELLEHLEHPEIALQIAKKNLLANGKVYLNIPINSPAPDHIYLYSSPEEVMKMVEDNGFRIIEIVNIPMTGHSLEHCLDKKLTISCLIIAITD